MRRSIEVTFAPRSYWRAPEFTSKPPIKEVVAFEELVMIESTGVDEVARLEAEEVDR